MLIYQQMHELRTTLELLDNANPVIDSMYSLNRHWYGEYHELCEDLNDAVWQIRNALTAKLADLEQTALVQE